MIYRTTVAFTILTLFFTKIARALPQACSDPIHSESKSVPHTLVQHTFVAAPIVKKVTWDGVYDESYHSMHTTACSDGANGLESKYPTFGDVPGFPYIGGADFIEWNSTECGSCWRLVNKANNATIFLTFIDNDNEGLNIGLTAYRTLAGGWFGEVEEVEINEEPRAWCGT